MILNDVLRSLRYMLDLADEHIIGTVHLADETFPLDKAQVQSYLKKDEEEGFVPCPDAMLARFLDGLVIHYRGRRTDEAPRPFDKRVTNNIVLKKLRVAFELKDTDLAEVFAGAGFAISKPEITALFRQPTHVNYRPCGDQVLRNFLKGLTRRVRGG
jgi:uncharacterized protein YehS (DUF1456 family)